MKIGILGGTFDPVHFGHLIVAEHVRQELSLGRVILVPAATPPHKKGVALADTEHRLAMVRLAVKKNPDFEVDDRELRRGGVSYTVDTLSDLASHRPHEEWYLLIGEDNLSEFESWKEPEKILRLAHVVVMTRPGSADPMRQHIRVGMSVCRVPEIGISSSDIRARVKAGRSIRYLVPAEVEVYITSHSLYR